MLTISGGDVWRCELPDDELPADPRARAAILKDFEGKWGDRRQELVFIGQKMREGGRERIQAVMDACLLDDEEFRAWERVMEEAQDKDGGYDAEEAEEKLAELFEDGFEDWISVDAHEGHDHGGAGDHYGHHH